MVINYQKPSYSKQPDSNIGKYGGMRLRYLEENRKATYNMMVLEGTLKQHLVDINEQAHQQINDMVSNLLKTNPAPDRATNHLGWIQHMNMLKAQAEEIVFLELIYI